MAASGELVRVVAGPDGALVPGRHQPGRGAWVCADSPACLDLAERRKAFDRALRTTLHRRAVDDLRTMLAERGRIEG